MCIYEGKEYYSDTGRFINKYDIFVCDLGDPVDNNIGKKRPCVIVQSDNFNDPKQGTYLVAPIRTEHTLEVSRETLDDVVKQRQQVGRFHIPIETEPNRFSFIDMTLTRSVHSSDILVYKYSILNQKLKKKINDALYELIFSGEEYSYIKDEYNTKTKSIVKLELVDDQEKYLSEEKVGKKTNKKLCKDVTIPNGFSIYYKKYKNKDMTVKQIAEKLDKHVTTVYKYIYAYEELNNKLQIAK